MIAFVRDCKSRPCGFGQSLGRPIVRSFSHFFWSTKKKCPVSKTGQKFFWSVSLVEGEQNWPKVHGHRLYLQLLLGTIDNFVNSLNSKSLRRCWDGNPQAFQSRTAKAQEAARELNIQAKDTFKEEQQKKASHQVDVVPF